jgi:hypothetical protein
MIYNEILFPATILDLVTSHNLCGPNSLLMCWYPAAVSDWAMIHSVYACFGNCLRPGHYLEFVMISVVLSVP